MAYYKLYRKEPQGKAVHGTLYLCLPGRRNETYLVPVAETLENNDYIIPAIIYKVVVTMSPKFRRLLPYLLQVPGRTGIRVHRGTKPEHSKGCILVSAANEQLLTASWHKDQNNHEETFIEICSQPHGT